MTDSHVTYATYGEFMAAVQMERSARKALRNLYAKLHNTPWRSKAPIRAQVRNAEELVATARKYTDTTFDRLTVADQQTVSEHFDSYDLDALES